jgi:pimeloyl-ACP methyl ester carboxylesterase
MSDFVFAKKLKYFTLLFVLFSVFNVSAQETTGEKPPEAEKPVAAAPEKKGRLPVIIIPGLIGSELVNKETGNKVWFSLSRKKEEDDLRLPISPKLSENRDGLIPGDILREIQIIRFTPKIDIYKKFIESMERDGYTEGKIDAPPEDGFSDTFYIFPYDWRLDNVENAHNLLNKLDELRLKLKRPNQKFDVVAHSMGGLIARYALSYGKADLSARTMRPNWAGAPYFNNIMLVGVPNGGSLSAFNSLQNGFSLFGSGKINLPFVRNLSKFDLFTIPSIYQLLPHEGLVRAYDGDLKPLKIDIYNPKTWEQYGWLAYNDENFNKKFNESEQAQAKAYFEAVLLRARLFQAALNAKPARKNPVPIYYLGSECKPTIDGMIIYKDKNDRWKTEFEADSFTKSDGTKVTKEDLEKVLFSPGDGVVAKRSLISSLINIGKLDNPRSGLVNDLTVVCGEHNRLTADEIIDKSLLSVLNLSVSAINKTVDVVKSDNR